MDRNINQDNVKEVFIVSVSQESPYDPNYILQEHVDSVFSSENLADEYVNQLVEKERNKHHNYCLKKIYVIGAHKYLGFDDPDYGSCVHYETYDFKKVVRIDFMFHGMDMENSIQISIVKMKLKDKV